MIMKIFSLENDIIFTEEYINVLQIQDKKLFTNVINSLNDNINNIEDTKERIIILDNDTEIKIEKEVLMFIDVFNIDFNHPIHVHFIGIGGISMSGLARILLDRHFTVSGSDAHESELTDELAKDGCLISYPQSADNITGDIDLVVYTAAIHPDNKELKAAIAAGIPTMTRAELLGQIMKNYHTVFSFIVLP